MPQTIWTQAATAILDALNGAGSPASAYRDRFEAVDSSEIAFNLFSTKVSISYTGAHDSASVDATITVRLSVGGIAADPVTGAAAVPVSLVADPLVLWAWRVVRANPTLCGLVSDVYPEEIETGYIDKSSSDQVCVDISFHVVVEVGRDDPSLNRTFMG